MKFFGKEISGPFTIPSGITATNINVLNRIAHDIPQVGVLTTKSIGPKFRLGNREPVITQYKPGCFMNAIGLTNPGADEFAKQLSKIKIPENKFLLTSIFGANAEEFVEVAKKLAPYSDGLELNLSCPHAKGYGMAIGQDPKLVKEIVAAVKAVVDIPVIPKLTPNTDKIKEIAKAAVEGGANGICAINTVGPGEFEVEGHPVLTNIKGGMSGKEILSKGLECIKNIASVVDVPIIGCGGISSADDVRLYQEAGAIVFGIGTALHGMHTTEVEEFFKVLEKDLESSTNESSKLVKQVDMSFKKFTLKENRKSATNFSVLVFDKSYDIKPGQFVFAWIPGVGEKPFSILDPDPLTLGVVEAGEFTKALINLEPGTDVYFRGPYGNPVIFPDDVKVVLVGGGSGFAAFYHMARDFKNVEVVVGARDKDHLFYIEETEKHAPVHIATEDGSSGTKGYVTEILKKFEKKEGEEIIFLNCGPPAMIKPVIEIEKKITDKIFSSIEYVTKCGVGLCGACSDRHGRRLCVDGPFLEEL